MLSPEIDVELTLYSPAHGGRRTHIRGEYRGMFSVESNQAFSVRFQLTDELPLVAEHSTTVGVQFLCPEDALPHFKVGTNFCVWEGRAIGHGRVVRLR